MRKVQRMELRDYEKDWKNIEEERRAWKRREGTGGETILTH